MADTDARIAMLMSALGFREGRIEDRAAARRGRLEAERVRQEPSIDFQFDRQRRAIDAAREDQGLYRSGLTTELQAENEFLRNAARSDFEAGFTNAQFDVWDATQQQLDDIELQRAQGRIDFFERDLLRQLQNQQLAPVAAPATPPLGQVSSTTRVAPRTTTTTTRPRTVATTAPSFFY